MADDTPMTAKETQTQAMTFFNPKMITSLLPALLPFLPMILIAATAKIKNPQITKIILAVAGAVTSLGGKDESAVKQAWRVVRDAITAYLGD